VGDVQAPQCVAAQATDKPATHWGKVAGCCRYATQTMETKQNMCHGACFWVIELLHMHELLMSLVSSGQNDDMLVVVVDDT